MYCQHCGLENTDTAKFCVKCGTAMAGEPAAPAEGRVLNEELDDRPAGPPPPISTGAGAIGDVGKACPCCRFPFKPGQTLVVCPTCSVTHHADCWYGNRGCGTFGCSGKAGRADGVTATVPARSTRTRVRPVHIAAAILCCLVLAAAYPFGRYMGHTEPPSAEEMGRVYYECEKMGLQTPDGLYQAAPRCGMSRKKLEAGMGKMVGDVPYCVAIHEATQRYKQTGETPVPGT